MGNKGGKVLLIKPDYNFYSIGMAYVVAGLRRRGIAYDFFDTHLDPYPELERLIRSNDYMAIATGGLIGSFTFFQRLLQTIRSIRPKVPCILGGNITQAIKPPQLLRMLPFDYLVLGEGELTLGELLEALDRGDRHPAALPGLAFPDPDDPARVIRTPPRPRLDLCQENWMPHWDAETMRRYRVGAFPVLSGRGCTGHCTFCAPTNGRFRGRPLPHILEELEFLNTHYDFACFNFLNEILFSDEADIERFCDEYEKLKLNKHWACLLRLDLDPRVLRRMSEAGLRCVNIGVESGSDRVLTRIKKEITVAQTRTFVQAMKDNNIIIEGSFMMAHLDEGPEDVRATIDLMNDLEIRGPMALTINYPGTYNYRMAKERGLVEDEEAYIRSLDNVYGVDPYDIISRHRAGELRYLNLSEMSDDELFRTAEREMRRYFSGNRVFSLRDVQAEATDQPEVIRLSGHCQGCGARLERPFDLARYCISDFRAPDCVQCGITDVYFKPEDVPGFAGHHGANRPRIEAASAVALLGNLGDVRWLLRHDHFHLDPSRIKGVVACGGVPDGYALNHPVRPLHQLLAEGIDLVVILGEVPQEVLDQGLIEQVGWDRIVFLTPTAWSRALADRPSPDETRARVRALRPPTAVDPVNAEYLGQRIRHLVDAWKAANARVVIHGASGHTGKLFDWTPIREANLVGLSDNSASLKGIHRFGFKVLASWEIPDAKPDVVLISSHAFQEEIRESLRFLEQQGIALVGCYE